MMFWKRKQPSRDLICPACLRVYSRHEIAVEWPLCTECYSEGADVEVVPYARFLAETDLEELETSRERILSEQDLLPEFKRHLTKQIGALIREKQKQDR